MATIGRPTGVANPYSLLELAPGASHADVKRAYRRLSMRFHPDRAGPGSLRTFLAVKAAYEWIVANPSLGEPGDRRPGSASRTTVARPVWRDRPKAARPAPTPAPPRSSWPGGRWYWEGIRARASRDAAPGSERR